MRALPLENLLRDGQPSYVAAADDDELAAHAGVAEACPSWLSTFWHQIKPFSTSNNADILVMAVMGVLSLAFILMPSYTTMLNPAEEGVIAAGASAYRRAAAVHRW